MPFAHTLAGQPPDRWEPLEEHLHQVADLAASFATAFNAKEWAHLAGLWHDLGKYGASFQEYLHAAAADPEAGHERRGTVNHSTAGAVHALDRFGPKGSLLGYLIAGHHAGLPDGQGGESSLGARIGMRQFLDEALAGDPPREILDAPLPSEKPPSGRREDLHTWLRMLFSCLTDADFLSTEAFMAADRSRLRTPWPDLIDLAPKLNAYIVRRFGNPRTEVERIREEIRCRSIERASLPPGLFSLTVPTGGGKTISSLAFALEHARIHGKRRVVYVIPYTSIVEQTADVFREIFGECVLEHHSNVDPDNPEKSGRG